MLERSVGGLFTSFTCCASRLIVTCSTSSIVTGNLFLAGLWRALPLPRRIENKGMRQDHATRPGEEREVEIRIETARRAIPACFLQVVRAVGVKFCPDPDQQVKDGKSLPVERRFTRWKQTLPGLRLIDEIEAWWDRQWRVNEELLQWPPPGREATLSVNTARLAISTAARDGISFGKILVKFKHCFVLLFILIEVEQ
jgi:hypothetical protein